MVPGCPLIISFARALTPKMEKANIVILQIAAAPLPKPLRRPQARRARRAQPEVFLERRLKLNLLVVCSETLERGLLSLPSRQDRACSQD